MFKRPKFIEHTAGADVVKENRQPVRPIEKWVAKDFLYYFQKRFFEVKGFPLAVTNNTEIGMLSRYRKSINDNVKMKELMDVYFDLGYDYVSVKHFVSNTRRNELNDFIINGVQPPFTKYRPSAEIKVEKKESINTRSLDEFFGGGK